MITQAAASPVAIAKLRKEMLARWSTEDDPLGLDRCRLLERVRFAYELNSAQMHVSHNLSIRTF